MPTVKLTDAAVQRFKAPPGGRVEYFDASLPGFGLRVAGPTGRSPEGRKSWVLFYRLGGEQRRLTLEPPYPALGLAAARKKAGDALSLVAEGKDPGEAKAERKAEAARKKDTFATVTEEFIRRSLEAKGRAPRYIEETRRNFTNHVLPRWGERDIKGITRRDVIELLDAIVDGGTEVKDAAGRKRTVPGGPICANRVLAAVRALFNWALRRGIIESTPAALVERPGEETQRERTLDADELRAVWEAAGTLGYPVGSFFRAALLTGQRREEVAGMRWADLDLQAGIWTIPAELTKAGRSHALPLSSAMLDLLAEVPRIGAYVFTSSGNRPIAGYSVAKARLDRETARILAKGKEPKEGEEPRNLAAWTIHDLRRTVATEMARLGVSRLVIGRVLNHADRSVTAIYDRHSYLPEKRHGLETWASQLVGLVEPAEGCVVALRA